MKKIAISNKKTIKTIKNNRADFTVNKNGTDDMNLNTAEKVAKNVQKDAPITVPKKPGRTRKTVRVARNPYPYMYNVWSYNADERQETLAERIRFYCEANGTTIFRLGKYLGMFAKRKGRSFSMPLIYQYVHMVCSPKIDNLHLMAAAMGVTPQWLAGYGPRGNMDRIRNLPVLDEVA